MKCYRWIPVLLQHGSAVTSPPGAYVAPAHLRAATVACYAATKCIGALLPAANSSRDAHTRAHNTPTLVEQRKACKGEQASTMAGDAVPGTCHCHSSKRGVKDLKDATPQPSPPRVCSGFVPWLRAAFQDDPQPGKLPPRSQLLLPPSEALTEPPRCRIPTRTKSRIIPSMRGATAPPDLRATSFGGIWHSPWTAVCAQSECFASLCYFNTPSSSSNTCS